MSIIAVAEMAKPEIKSHHKPRHLKKFAVGPFAETCVEFRFAADLEKFDALDDALTAMQDEQGWELFVAYFNEKYHVAVSFFTDQESVDDAVATVTAILTETLGQAPELTVLAGDANYGLWDDSYNLD